MSTVNPWFFETRCNNPERPKDSDYYMEGKISE